MAESIPKLPVEFFRQVDRISLLEPVIGRLRSVEGVMRPRSKFTVVESATFLLNARLGAAIKILVRSLNAIDGAGAKRTLVEYRFGVVKSLLVGESLLERP